MYGVLNAKQIMELSSREPVLVSGCIDFSEQIQPCGVDLTVSQITTFISAGKITRSNRDRLVSETRPVQFDSNGQAQLGAGAYLITYNETVNLPLNLTALVLPRSSLLRSGVTIHTAVWDPGYSGKGQSLLTVFNPEGLILEKDARLSQMVFFVLEETPLGYGGIYQGENL